MNCRLFRDRVCWPAPGSEDTELGVLMELVDDAKYELESLYVEAMKTVSP